jgi:sec-independent protein translocase protein TatC
MEREKIFYFLTGLKRFTYKALIFVAISSIISFIYSKELIQLLLRVVGIKVYYLSLPEPLFSSVEIAIYAGIFFALPVIIYLALHEFSNVLGLKPVQGYMFAFFSILLFYVGSIFCYLIVLPSGIKFLVSYESSTIKAMISLERFVIFCTAMMFAFGITFEVPVILLILGRMGILKSKTLTKTRRFAILFIAIASAVITPTPDVYNMMLLAVPMYLLYEIGILLMKIGERRDKNARRPDIMAG